MSHDKSQTTDRCECDAMSAIECGEMPGRHCGMWERQMESVLSYHEQHANFWAGVLFGMIGGFVLAVWL